MLPPENQIFSGTEDCLIVYEEGDGRWGDFKKKKEVQKCTNGNTYPWFVFFFFPLQAENPCRSSLLFF